MGLVSKCAELHRIFGFELLNNGPSWQLFGNSKTHTHTGLVLHNHKVTFNERGLRNTQAN